MSKSFITGFHLCHFTQFYFTFPFVLIEWPLVEDSPIINNGAVTNYVVVRFLYQANYQPIT